MRRTLSSVLTLALLLGAIACGKKTPAATPGPAGPSQFPGAVSPGGGGGTPPAPPGRPPEPPIVPVDNPITAGDPLETAEIADINKNSPLKPVYFAYDSDTLDDAARKALADNAQVLKKYPTWVITVEGHCDERGTPEYNLALGDRRALAAKNYLQSLGIGADRLRTVSYGKEFPFDPGHDDKSWSVNRRAHFMLTSR